MRSNKVQETTYWLLIQAAIRSRQTFARLAEKHFGLTGGQMYTLCLLEPGIPAAMNTLSCQMACDASNITGIADRLEVGGYIIRQNDPHDRRITMLALTSRGERVRLEIMRALIALEPEGMRALTLEERHTLHTLLAKALIAAPSSH